MSGKTSTAAKRKYNDKVYSRVVLDIKKDDKTAIVEAAKIAGKSTTAFILEAVREKMEKEEK